MNSRILTLEIINNQYVFSNNFVPFTIEGEKYIDKLKELEKNSYLVSFKTLKSNEYNKDFKYFDKKFLKAESLKEFNSYITWRLESGVSKLYDKLKYKNEDLIIINNKEINTMDLIYKMDNIDLLKYCINSENISNQFKSDPLYLDFDFEKNPKCFKLIETLKRDIEIENILERDL